MKKMMLAVAAVALGGWAVANAGEKETDFEINREIQSVAIQQQQEQQDSVRRTLVEPENLPDPVKTALSGEEYTGWTVASAYLVESAKKSPYYEISLEREGEENLKVVKLNADGKRKDGDIKPPTPPTNP